ncbi:myotubularin-related protein 8 [Latimeria chalumnae]|uniref:myotubularin-related protein 8 n=1 Tax=Latimeria chalumnae TaxID=7897 RepID=UPI0003C12415|nr:PREDICTED: myotubularin-related protein 8 [Latimeria chalumnae]|eukprot:XP_005994997.1 PREDICTED: myotubularin-related protein 8 [Latimeria chalumnae]
MEHIITPKVEHVKLLDRYTNKKPAIGTLYLTATHLIYVETSVDVRKEIWILHHHIAALEKLPLTTTGCPLLIRCKNFRLAHFLIPRERDCHDVYTSLLRLSQPVKYEELYAFSYHPKQREDDREIGWKIIDLKVEFQRMGVPNDNWEITDVNKDYGICNTYPPDLCIPKTANKPTIVGSSKFRSRGRFPVLSYFCKDTNAAICRCSQPLSGFSARCVEDEQMLQAINKANPGSPFMYVVDTRPKLNAMANRAAGKGYENEDNYSNIRFQFIGIENIHVMRSSLQKLLEVCEMKSPSMSDFLTGLENSGWLKHIKAIMDAAVFLTKAVTKEKASVLVHCSDGWDRTAQVCSIAGLLLDPFYRTLKGLTVLIEKEWISMGHKFTQRCGYLEGDPKEVSPVFTQFIECIWQLMEQFPCAFEFNEKYLLEIHDHAFSCQFGNFIGNCHKEREDMKICKKTNSLWSFLLAKKQQYQNPLYKGGSAYGLLKPNTLPFNFKFWCSMYNHFDKGMHPKQSELECLLTSINNKMKLEGNVTELENKLPMLEGALQDDDDSILLKTLPIQLSSDLLVLCTAQDYTEGQEALLPNGAEEEEDSLSGLQGKKGSIGSLPDYRNSDSTVEVTNARLQVEIKEDGTRLYDGRAEE